MRLDYIPNMTEYGDNTVRLYDFDRAQAEKFKQFIEQRILAKREELDLSTVDFIEPRNCNLILRIAEEDLGIVKAGRKKFFCDLTIEGYERMISLLEPFCKRETKGYQWLYDIDTETDFLFSPAGTW